MVCEVEQRADWVIRIVATSLKKGKEFSKNYLIADFGKTVFLTRAEALAALQEVAT